MRAPAVRAAAKRCRPWAEGGDKVYLCDVAAELGVGLESIAAELIEMQQHGDIVLSRADLVAAFDAQKLEASTVRYSNSEWQLLNI